MLPLLLACTTASVKLDDAETGLAEAGDTASGDDESAAESGDSGDETAGETSGESGGETGGTGGETGGTGGENGGQEEPGPVSYAGDVDARFLYESDGGEEHEAACEGTFELLVLPSGKASGEASCEVDWGGNSGGDTFGGELRGLAESGAFQGTWALDVGRGHTWELGLEGSADAGSVELTFAEEGSGARFEGTLAGAAI